MEQGTKISAEISRNDLRQHNSSQGPENWRGALFGCATCINTAVTGTHTPFPMITAGPGGSLNSE